MNIGNQIRAIRKSKGIRQKDLAKSVGITQPYLCQIEKGRGTTIHTLSAICKELGARVILTIEEDCDE